MLYVHCALFILTLTVTCRVQKAMAMINVFFLCSTLKERKANIRRNVNEAL